MSWVASNNITMFPSSLRGNVINSLSNRWDPQSRFTTETNLTSLINRLCGKSSFVISSELIIGVSGNYEFNIRGYYFKIINTEAAFNTFDSSTDIYAIIQLKDIAVSLPDSPSVALGTLVSVESIPSTILDSTDESSSEFKGLLLGSSTTGYTDDSKYHYLKIATRATVSDLWSIPEESKLIFSTDYIKFKNQLIPLSDLFDNDGNALTAADAIKLITARLFTITDNDGSHSQAADSSFDGSAPCTLKLPATIKAAIEGTASGNLTPGGALGTPSSGNLSNCNSATDSVAGVIKVGSASTSDYPAEVHINTSTGKATAESVPMLVVAKNVTSVTNAQLTAGKQYLLKSTNNTKLQYVTVKSTGDNTGIQATRDVYLPCMISFDGFGYKDGQGVLGGYTSATLEICVAGIHSTVSHNGVQANVVPDTVSFTMTSANSFDLYEYK